MPRRIRDQHYVRLHYFDAGLREIGGHHDHFAAHFQAAATADIRATGG
jgi:hypothetical protein